MHLAVSLHAVTDELRSRLMPINRKWPIAELLRKKLKKSEKILESLAKE